MASGVRVGLVAAGSESCAPLPAGRPTTRQSKERVCPSAHPAALSASVTVAERVTTSPMFGSVELAVAVSIEGIAEPHFVVLTVTNLGADCRPVESVATTENWYAPIWSGVNVVDAAVGSVIAAGRLTEVQTSVKVWPRPHAASLSASWTVAESWTTLPLFGFAGLAVAVAISGAVWPHLRTVTWTWFAGLERTPFETTRLTM